MTCGLPFDAADGGDLCARGGIVGRAIACGHRDCGRRGRLRHWRRELGFRLHDRLAVVGESHVEVRLEGRARGNQVPENHVFLEADQRVFLTRDGGFREDLGSLLEAGRRHERLRLQRRLRDAQEEGLGGRHLRAFALRDRAVLFLSLGVDFLKFVAADDLADAQAGIPGLIDADHLGERFVAVTETELIDDFAGEELRIAGVLDLHLPQHLRNDDFDVLVADLLVLRAVDVLDFREQIRLQSVFALDAKDVMRNERTFNERIAGIDGIASVNAERRGLRNVVFLFDAAFAANDNGLLAAAFVALDFDDAGNLRHDCGFLGFPRFEDFSDARETGRDVRRALGFLGLTGEQMTGDNDLTGVHVDAGFRRQEVEVEDLAIRRIHDLNLGMAFALVFDNNETLAAFLAFRFGANGFAFLDVLEFNTAGLFRQNRNAVRVPNSDLLAALDRILFLHEQRGTVRNLLAFEFATLGIHKSDEAVALQHDRVTIAFMIGDINAVQIAIFNDARGTRTDVVLGRGDVADTAGVERTHRQLRARFANGLCGNDAGGKTFFDQLARREIDAVAPSAHAGERFTSQRRADADGFDVQILDLRRNDFRDDLAFANDRLIRDRVDDRIARTAANDRFAERHVDLFALVDRGLADAVLRAAIVLADDDILRHVGELAGEVSGVGSLESRIRQALTSTVGRGEILEHREAFAEVGLDGRFHDLAGGTRHKATHTRKLPEVIDAATSLGISH